MQCPKCDADMERVIFESVEVDRCTRCQGLWFDASEREDLLKKRGAESIDTGNADEGREMNRIDRINCPRCHVRMVKMVDARQHHIWYEGCAMCGGSFMDAGEFRDLKAYTVVDFFRDLFTRTRR